MRLGDVADDRVVQCAGVDAIAVEGDAADRRPRLRDDAVLDAECLHFLLLEVGVALDLVDRGYDGGLFEERLEMFDHEVADADRANLAVAEQRFESAVGVKRAVEV